MLTITTHKHKTFVAIPGISGSSNDCFTAYGALIDSAIDRLYDRSQADAVLTSYLEYCTNRMDGYEHIARHLKAVTPDQRWLRDCAATDLCRTVIDLLQPEFERKRLAIADQIEEAKRVIARFAYKTPAAVTQTLIANGTSVYGFRFIQDARIGQTIKNDDHTTSHVVAVVPVAT